MIPGRLLELCRGYRASRVFLSAVDLDLFGRLGAERLGAAAIAARLGTDVSATEVLLDALVALELLDRTAEGYANRERLGVLWKPEARRRRLGLVHASRTWEAWSRLTETVRVGRRAGAGTDPGADPEWVAGIRQFSAEHTEVIAAALDWSRVGRLIDVGGGSGVHSIGLARRHPGLHAVVFDSSPAALEDAADGTAAAGVGARVTLREGDLLRDDLGSGYDAALLSSLICLFEEQDGEHLLRRVGASVSEHGSIVVHDLMLDGSGAAPAGAALFAVHLLVTSPHGRCHRRADVERWVRAAGFPSVRTEPAGAATIIVGSRASEPGGR